MATYKETYLEAYLDEFRFLDPECHDTRVREINMRSKRCNRCQGFNECKMHPSFWLFGEPIRLDENERMPDELGQGRSAASQVAEYQRVVARERYDVSELDAND